MIESPAVTFGREEAERHAESDREDHRSDCELDRRREALLELVGDVAMRRQALPKSKARRLDVLPVLDVDRLVEPEALLVLPDELGRRALAEEESAGLPGRARTQTKTRIEPDQNRDEEHEPADDETKHQSSAGSALSLTGLRSRPRRRTRSLQGWPCSRTCR